MKNNLPDNWVAVKLDSIVKELNSGFACGAHNSTGDGIAHLRPMNVTSKGAISLKDLRSVSATSYDKLVKGDVLFNNTNSTELVGKTAYIEEDTDWGYSNHMTRLRFNPALINSRFVSYYIHNLFYEGYFRANCNNHVSQASISAKFLANEVTIPLPPFAEQNRIVAQLEATMQKLEASQERLENLPALLKKFRQAVLAAAISGKLTKIWRAELPQKKNGADLLDQIHAERRALQTGKQSSKSKGKQLTLGEDLQSTVEHVDLADRDDLPDLPEGWVYDSVGNSIKIIDYRGRTPPFSGNDQDIPHLRSSNIKRGKVIWNDLAYITEEVYAEFMTRGIPEVGDVLLTSEAPLGEVAMVPDQKFSLAQRMMVLRPLPGLNSEFIRIQFMSDVIQTRLRNRGTGTTVTGIAAKHFKPMAIAIPPMGEQLEIIRQVNHYFDLADQLEARFEQAAALVEQLPQALLAKAFSGQLVPQDPNDEPASALLERLQASATTAVKGKRGRTPKAMTKAPLFN